MSSSPSPSPHDSLVLNFTYGRGNDVYVFWDYTTQLFGIRGRTTWREPGKQKQETRYSLESGKVQGVMTFLGYCTNLNPVVNISDEMYVRIGLLSDLPKVASEITYDMLVEMDQPGPDAFPLLMTQNRTVPEVHRLLEMLMDVYTEYK